MATPAAEPAKAPEPVKAPEAPKAAETPETPEAKTAREKKEADDFAAQETKLFGGLVEYYKLPDDMAEKLATEPELVLPHMAARVHQAIAKGVQRMIAEQLPQYIDHHMQVSSKEAAAKKAFYDAWPQLAKNEAEVLRAAQLYNQLNPNATPEQRIKAVGRIVAESLGIAVAAPGTPGAPAAAVPAPAPAPFRPAAGGGAVAGKPPSPDNEFTAIADDLLRE